MTRLLLGLLACGLLAGCGKVGPPRRAGPPEEITYPRGYPNPNYQPRGGLPGIWQPDPPPRP